MYCAYGLLACGFAMLVVWCFIVCGFAGLAAVVVLWVLFSVLFVIRTGFGCAFAWFCGL